MKKEIGLGIFVLFGILAIIYDAVVLLPKRSPKDSTLTEQTIPTPITEFYEFSAQSVEVSKTFGLGTF